MTAAPEEVPKRAISTVRLALAVALALVAIVGTLGYHDAAFDVDNVAEATEPGFYRFKGELQPWEGNLDGFVLVDPTGRGQFQWNLTAPQPGEMYVVEAEILDDGTTRALAVSPVYVFEGRWF